MSEQEKKTGGAAAGGSPVVMVEQSTASRHKQPYRPTDLQDEAPPDPHHKRSRAPAVPTAVAEALKVTVENTDIKGKEAEHAMSSEKHKHIVAKKLSSTTKRRETSPEPIIAPPIELELKKTENVIAPTAAVLPAQPIPADPKASAAIEIAEKAQAERKSDEDSITEEIAELRTPEPPKKSGEWSDDEEASGLPRSDSRASRVSRAVRQLFCCGVPYEAPSEEDVASPRHGVSDGI